MHAAAYRKGRGEHDHHRSMCVRRGPGRWRLGAQGASPRREPGGGAREDGLQFSGGAAVMTSSGTHRVHWNVGDIKALLALPFHDLIFLAQTVHRENFDPNTVQLSTLLSIKTGGCPEDCGYCPQAARHHTCVGNQELLPLEEVVAAASAARASGATRFCMGAAWRGPKAKDLVPVLAMVSAVKALGLETCA